jgi:hypothetical protein
MTNFEMDEILSHVDNLLAKNSQKLCTSEEDILKEVINQHNVDYNTAMSSPLVMEEVPPKQRDHLQYEWIQGESVAIQSLEPVLNRTEIDVIKSAVEELWNDQDGSGESLFTYQYKGNSEAHSSDLKKKEATGIINQLLQNKLYPCIRSVFLETLSVDESLKQSQLFVYDSLIIRYNATASDSTTAGQPLHRDLGYVSVNIMLNDGFEGGGTFFENQNRPMPLKPGGGCGHCICHYSDQRHAGAGTTSGVRDILVFFISVKELIPRILNAHLKQTRHACDNLKDIQDEKAKILCRIQRQKMAVKTCPDDGEAHLYLGSALMEYAKLNLCMESIASLQHAIQCFRFASQAIPNDFRVYNNLGIALSRLKDQSQPQGTDLQHLDSSIIDTYQQGLDLLLQATDAGCACIDDMDSLSLNYGLFLANQNMFNDACKVLARPNSRWKEDEVLSQIIEDAHKLYNWCWCMEQDAIRNNTAQQKRNHQ